MAGHLPGWAYLAVPAGAGGLFLAIRRLMRPQLGSGLRPLVPAVYGAATLTEAGLRETGHRVAWEYVNPRALAGECPSCEGTLVIITAGGGGCAEVHGSPSLTRDCEQPRPCPRGVEGCDGTACSWVCPDDGYQACHEVFCSRCGGGNPADE